MGGWVLTFKPPPPPPPTQRFQKTFTLSNISGLLHLQLSSVFFSIPAPVLVAVQINGTGYASDILKDMLSSFDVLQKGNITVLSKKCIMQPSEPDYSKYILIGKLHFMLLPFIGRFTAFFMTNIQVLDSVED